jgi:RNA polymerase sigma factor (sigma-70 family)
MERAASNSPGGGDGYWEKTVWTVILAVEDPRSPNHQQAREQFAGAYWRPIYEYVRKRGRSREEAQDLTQEFFWHLLERKVLAGLTREGGKFRSFLLKNLTNFMASQWNWKQAKKRPGGKVHIPFDEFSEASYEKDLADQETPETSYDRKYAGAVVEQVLSHLKAEYVTADKGGLFDCLKGFLPGAQQGLSYEEVSRALDMEIEAVRMAVCRLRKRCGELLRREVAAPGMKPQEIDEELRYLMNLLGRSRGRPEQP